jgi:hypothetical protein
VKIRDVIRLIERDGEFLVVTEVAIAVQAPRKTAGHNRWHLSEDLAPGTLNSVLKQAGLRKPKEGSNAQVLDRDRED